MYASDGKEFVQSVGRLGLLRPVDKVSPNGFIKSPISVVYAVAVNRNIYNYELRLVRMDSRFNHLLNLYTNLYKNLY